MSGPSFDLTKFYRLRCTAPQFGAVMRTLRKVDEVMKQRLRSHRMRSLWMFLAIVVGAVAIATVPGMNGLPSLALSVTALAFLYVLGCLRMLFMKGKPPINRALLVFGLINPGVFIYMAAGSLLLSAQPLLDFRRAPLGDLVALAMSSLVMVFALRLTSGMRWKTMAPQEVELAYVERIVRPLLADLPKGTRSDVLFNPFAGAWSRVEMPARQRPGYTYEAFADILLRLRIPLDPERTLRLFIHEFSVSKTKNRKSKYKGTKHAIVVRYDIPLLAGARTDKDELRQAMQKALAGNDQGAVTLVAKDGRLTVYQVKKTADQSRELSEGHLIPATTILKTVAFLSRASLPLPVAA